MKYLVKSQNITDEGSFVIANDCENAIKEYIDHSGLGIIRNGWFTVWEIDQVNKTDLRMINGKSFNVNMTINITERK